MAGPAKTTSPRRNVANADAPFGVRRQVEGLAALHPGVDRTGLLLSLSVYRTFAILDRNLAAELAAIRLTTTQLNILMTLDLATGPLTMGELASMLIVQPTNLSGIVGQLDSRRLLRRKASAEDKRALHVELTANGRKLLARYLPHHSRQLDRLMASLTDANRTRLAVLLRALVRSMQQAEESVVGAVPRKKSAPSRARKPATR